MAYRGRSPIAFDCAVAPRRKRQRRQTKAQHPSQSARGLVCYPHGNTLRYALPFGICPLPRCNGQRRRGGGHRRFLVHGGTGGIRTAATHLGRRVECRPRVGRAPLVDRRRARGQNRAGPVLRACAHDPIHRGDRARLRRPARYGREPCPADERFRLHSGRMQRACIAFSIYRPRKRSSNQRARPNPYRNHEPPREPAHRWRSRPQRHRHCAEAHLHPRRQCRRRSTRCARTSRCLCAASRDLPLVLGHFR